MRVLERVIHWQTWLLYWQICGFSFNGWLNTTCWLSRITQSEQRATVMQRQLKTSTFLFPSKKIKCTSVVNCECLIVTFNICPSVTCSLQFYSKWHPSELIFNTPLSKLLDQASVDFPQYPHRLTTSKKSQSRGDSWRNCLSAAFRCTSPLHHHHFHAFDEE